MSASIEKRAKDEYQLGFCGKTMVVDAQALIDLARWVDIHRTSILVDIDMKDVRAEEIARNRSQGAKDGWEIRRGKKADQP